jgi:cytochrome b561
MVNGPRRLSEENATRKRQTQSAATMTFKTHVGLIALFGAACIATCAGAFSSGTTTFVRQHVPTPVLSSTGRRQQLGVGNTAALSTALQMSSGAEPEGDDLHEWKALVAAFQMYKAAYGDLRVPLRFIVPSMPPWPSKYTALCIHIVVYALIFYISKHSQPTTLLNPPTYRQNRLGA